MEGSSRIRRASSIAFVFVLVASGAVLLGTAPGARANSVLLEGSFTRLLMDPVRPWAYVGDAGHGAVVVWNTSTDMQIASIPLGGAPAGMDFSPDGSRLYAGVGNALADIDLATLAVVRDIPLSGTAVDVAVTGNDLAFVTTQDTFGYARIVDLAAGREVGNVTATGLLYEGALARTDPTRTVLFLGNSTLSPGSMFKLRPTADNASLVSAAPFDGVGSFPNDAVATPGGEYLIIAAAEPVYRFPNPGYVEIMNTTSWTVAEALDGGVYYPSVSYAPAAGLVVTGGMGPTGTYGVANAWKVPKVIPGTDVSTYGGTDFSQTVVWARVTPDGQKVYALTQGFDTSVNRFEVQPMPPLFPPPTVLYYSPVPGTTVGSSTVTIHAVITEPVAGVNGSSIRLTVDGTPYPMTYSASTLVATTGLIGPLPDGNHTVRLRVSSFADATTNATWSFFTDTTPPVLTVPSSVFASAPTPAGAYVSFTATAFDAVAGAAYVFCNPASGSLFPVGTTPVACSAQDNAGNVGWGNFTVTVADTAPPATVVLSATDGNGFAIPPGSGTPSNAMTLAFTATDNFGVVGFVCSLDGAAFASCASPFHVAGLAPGSHAFLVAGVDAAGNRLPVSFLWTVLTPTGTVQNLIDRVDALQACGSLTSSQAGALLKPLKSALSALEAGKIPSAIDYLKTFLATVRNDAKKGILTPSEAAPLQNEGCDLVLVLGGAC